MRESATFDTSERWNTHGLKPGPKEEKWTREHPTSTTSDPEPALQRRPTRAVRPPGRLHAGTGGAGYTFHTDAYHEGYAFHTYALPTPDIPASMKKAVHGPNGQKWKKAGIDELDSLNRYNVYEVVDIPPRTRLLHMLWVLAKKEDEHGNVVRYKARTVVNGSQQVEGLHYNETAAPVPTAATIRTVLAVSAARGLKVRQWDFETAFLNSPIEEEVYVHPPYGVHVPKGKCWRLKKCIYGLKQASRSWFMCLVDALKSQGLTQSEADPCLFIGKDSMGQDYYFVFHVDDVMLAVQDKKTEEKLHKALSKLFRIKRMGDISWFLGMKVTRTKAGYRIDQEKYTTDILRRFGSYDVTPVDTPGVAKDKLAAAASRPLTEAEQKMNTPAKVKLYKAIIGSVLYAAMMTRPDIACVVGLLSRVMDGPRAEHWAGVHRLFRYLRGTTSLGLTFSGSVKLSGHTDANWGGDTNKKSTSGYVFSLNGGAISWASKRQHATALSSCESEYYAASLAISEAIWLRLLCAELGMKITGATTVIWEDNQGAIALSKGPSKRRVSKHIDIRHHFIRQHVAEKSVKLQFVRTHDNVADAMTKPLPRPAFIKHRWSLMGEKPRPYTYAYAGGMDYVKFEKRST